MKMLTIAIAGMVLSLSVLAFDLQDALKDSLIKGVANSSSTAPATTTSGVDQLKSKEINSGIVEALIRGSEAAVAQLGKNGGFMSNEALRIPLPPMLQKVEQIMRTMGMGKQADELILSMNSAAESAIPAAKALLVKSVKEMTLDDAKDVVSNKFPIWLVRFGRTASLQIA